MAQNFVQAINEKIYDFVQRPENSRLQRGTGAYSTPFRGKLFGEDTADAVARELATRRVDVLWLGANPNMPRSLTQIVEDSDNSDFRDFNWQMDSGRFASAVWDNAGGHSPDWDPSHYANWHVYRDVFKSVADIEAVAMANFLPWGSGEMRCFIMVLAALSPALASSVFHFSDDLLQDVIQATRPRLIAVPFSIGRSSHVDKVFPVRIALRQATDKEEHRVLSRPGGKLTYFTGVSSSGVPVVYLPHPVSLRIAGTHRSGVIGHLSETLSKAIEAV